MTWLLGVALFLAGVAVGVGVAVSVASSATAREIERLDRQWTLSPPKPRR